jgi:prepilin-type N-terminal cleavage/methylation domain-containing protein
MSKPIHNPSGPSPAAGFTLLELVVAMALSLLLFGLALTLVQQLGNTADVVGSMSDVNENLRAAVNMVSRDLSTAGENIPRGGIPLPYGGTAATINRPYPSGSTFPTPASGNTLYIPVITAGNALGPTQGSGANAINTDVVTIIGVNQTSQFNQTAVTGSPTVAATSATITVSTTAAGYVQAGQLIMLANSNGYCLLAVSSVNTTSGVITFTHGDTTHDPLGINQFSGPTTGTINQLETTGPPASWPAITAFPISMVTYYLDSSTPRRLMRCPTQVCTGTASAAQPVALGINVMQIYYSLNPLATLNGVTSDPTENPWPTTSDPKNSPNNIRKVVLTMIGETDHLNHANGQWYSKEIKNAVTVQNLDYYNKYSLGASLTAD